MSGENVTDKLDLPQLVVKLRTAGFMLDAGATKIRKLINKGELDSFLDDGVRKVTVASSHRYLAKKIPRNENDCSKTTTAAEVSRKLAQRRRLEEGRQIAAERREQQMTARAVRDYLVKNGIINRTKTATAVETSLKLAHKRRLQKARAMAEERRRRAAMISS